VASISLAGVLSGTAKADEVAAALRAAQTSKCSERWVFRGGRETLGAYRDSLKLLKGVRRVSPAGDDPLIVRADPGVIDPTALGEAGEGLEVVEPVPVRVRRRAKPGPSSPAALEIPGTWHRSAQHQGRMWITALLLDPDRIQESGLAVDLRAVRYTFFDLPKGGSAVRVFRAGLAVKGVVGIIPDVFNDALTVVVRPGAFDDAAVRAAFTKAGAEPDAEEADDDG